MWFPRTDALAFLQPQGDTGEEVVDGLHAHSTQCLPQISHRSREGSILMYHLELDLFLSACLIIT
jgi:hypothetical protein